MAKDLTPTMGASSPGLMAISEHNLQSASEVDIATQYDISKSSLAARKISGTIMVKKCISGKREYQNQTHAWHALNGVLLNCNRVLRVPRPLRYFELADYDGFPSSYIVMEYLEGNTLEVGLDKKILPDVAEAICRAHHETARSMQTQPGPLDGDPADGFPWGENGCESRLRNVAALQMCVNKRLQDSSQKSLNLHNMNLVFCHGDLALRNIMLMSTGDIAILDWASAAYYPAIFELGSLAYLATCCPLPQSLLIRELLEILESTCESEKSDISALCVVHQRSIGNSCE